jgi:probable F420-dependent oxidoreductase
MRIGGQMFFTDYSMTPTELARALEERGFDSLWVPEHSHIPLTRKSPFPSGGDLPKKYFDVMDPFVVLSAAAAVTTTLLLGTGICLIAQRDPIQTAKQVASIDQVSGGRFLFGVGNGWNEDEMANHGTAFASRHKLAHERIEAMKVIWTQSKAEYHVRELRSDDDLAEAGPETASADHGRRGLPIRRAASPELRQRLDASPLTYPVCRCADPAAEIPRDGD